MGIFDRFSNALRSNLNALLNKAEDPAKLHEQIILDLEESKKKAQALLVKCLGANKIAAAKSDACDKAIALYAAQAEALLGAQDEEGAKEIIAAKQKKEQESALLKEEMAANTHAVDTIHQGLQALEKKITILKSARPISDAVNRTDAFDTYSRMEEKIDRQEAEVQALQELLEDKVLPSAPSSSLGKKPELSLEEELDELKKKMRN